MIDFVPCHKHIPHRALCDRLCAENAIVTEKHIFPDKLLLFLLPLSSFLTVTNTLNLIDSIVSNHASLFPVAPLYIVTNTHTVGSKREAYKYV